MPNLRMNSINTLSNIVSFIETGMKTAWDAGKGPNPYDGLFSKLYEKILPGIEYEPGTTSGDSKVMNDTLVMDYAKEVLGAIGKRKEQITQDGGMVEHALEMQIIDSYEILLREIAAGNDMQTEDKGVLAEHMDPTFVGNIQSLSNLKAPKNAEEWKQLEKDAQAFSLTSLMQAANSAQKLRLEYTNAKKGGQLSQNEEKIFSGKFHDVYRSIALIADGMYTTAYDPAVEEIGEKLFGKYYDNEGNGFRGSHGLEVILTNSYKALQSWDQPQRVRKNTINSMMNLNNYAASFFTGGLNEEEKQRFRKFSDRASDLYMNSAENYLEPKTEDQTDNPEADDVLDVQAKGLAAQSMNLIAGRKAALKEEDEKAHKLEIAMLDAHELVLTQMHEGQNFHDDEMKENPAFFAAFNCMRRMKQPKNREQWEELEKNTTKYPIDEFFRLATAQQKLELNHEAAKQRGRLTPEEDLRYREEIFKNDLAILRLTVKLHEEAGKENTDAVSLFESRDALQDLTRGFNGVTGILPLMKAMDKRIRKGLADGLGDENYSFASYEKDVVLPKEIELVPAEPEKGQKPVKPAKVGNISAEELQRKLVSEREQLEEQRRKALAEKDRILAPKREQQRKEEEERQRRIAEEKKKEEERLRKEEEEKQRLKEEQKKKELEERRKREVDGGQELMQELMNKYQKIENIERNNLRADAHYKRIGIELRREQAERDRQRQKEEEERRLQEEAREKENRLLRSGKYKNNLKSIRSYELKLQENRNDLNSAKQVLETATKGTATILSDQNKVEQTLKQLPPRGIVQETTFAHSSVTDHKQAFRDMLTHLQEVRRGYSSNSGEYENMERALTDVIALREDSSADTVHTAYERLRMAAQQYHQAKTDPWYYAFSRRKWLSNSAGHRCIEASERLQQMAAEADTDYNTQYEVDRKARATNQLYRKFREELENFTYRHIMPKDLLKADENEKLSSDDRLMIMNVYDIVCRAAKNLKDTQPDIENQQVADLVNTFSKEKQDQVYDEMRSFRDRDFPGKMAAESAQQVHRLEENVKFYQDCIDELKNKNKELEEKGIDLKEFEEEEKKVMESLKKEREQEKQRRRLARMNREHTQPDPMIPNNF